MPILDQYGNPIAAATDRVESSRTIRMLRRQIRNLTARYDAAQTTTDNENHWNYTDHLDPHAANSLPVRSKLRIRSRYEVIENNPYLKGCVLTLANDFTGSGPKVQILQEGWNEATRKKVETEFARWWTACNLTTKLWRMRVAKCVDGEGFMFAYSNERRQLEYRDLPVTLDMFPVETDRVSAPLAFKYRQSLSEADGLRWNKYDEPIQYNLLPYHPGTMLWPNTAIDTENWINADNVIHWFRQDRGWLRGIPELTPSLPLCAMLRRYTLAVVEAAEIAANFSAVMETEGPPFNQAFSGEDDPFDTVPVERGMFLRLPWGYKMSQLRAEQPIQVYDMFVNALLREICRPINMPFNLSSGTSKDANMASAIVDAHIYRGAQQAERTHCQTHVLDQIFCLWYREARLVNGYLPPNVRFNRNFPSRSWRWERVGLDHTDPQKVQLALQVAHDKGFITDRDIQESYYNRDVEDWRKEVEEDIKFRKKVGLFEEPTPPVLPEGMKPPAKPPAKASNGFVRH